jgi:hypothetical protein
MSVDIKFKSLLGRKLHDLRAVLFGHATLIGDVETGNFLVRQIDGELSWWVYEQLNEVVVKAARNPQTARKENFRRGRFQEGVR